MARRSRRFRRIDRPDRWAAARVLDVSDSRAARCLTFFPALLPGSNEVVEASRREPKRPTQPEGERKLMGVAIDVFERGTGAQRPLSPREAGRAPDHPHALRQVELDERLQPRQGSEGFTPLGRRKVGNFSSVRRATRTRTERPSANRRLRPDPGSGGTFRRPRQERTWPGGNEMAARSLEPGVEPRP